MRVPFDLLRSQRVKFETLHARIFPLFEGLSETLKKERREMYRKCCYRVRAFARIERRASTGARSCAVSMSLRGDLLFPCCVETRELEGEDENMKCKKRNKSEKRDIENTNTYICCRKRSEEMTENLKGRLCVVRSSCKKKKKKQKDGWGNVKK